MGKKSCVLDGDDLRLGLCKDLDFSIDGRKENIKRAGEAAKLLAQTGLIAICAFISPFRFDRSRLRQLCADSQLPFLEVFVKAPLEVCVQRDVKGLYRRVRDGEITEFTGIDSPYEEPTEADIVVHTDLNEPDFCAQSILNTLLNLSNLS